MKNSVIPFEHERRFFPKLEDLPFVFSLYPMAFIVQGYLVNNGKKIRFRDEYRNKKHTYWQTIKSGKGVSRLEDEDEITREYFEYMWDFAECSLAKSRYFIPWEGLEIELNLFHDDLSGYVQIEVEFDSSEAAITFAPPPWFGREVTNDSRHGNYSLSKFGSPKN